MVEFFGKESTMVLEMGFNINATTIPVKYDIEKLFAYLNWLESQEQMVLTI